MILDRDDESYIKLSSLKMSQSHLIPPTNLCLCHPSFHSNPAYPSTNTSPISNHKLIYKHSSPKLSPMTSRCPIEAELEGRSDTGLSPPNSNITPITNLDLRLTPPARDSTSLCNTPTYTKQSSLTPPKNPCLSHPIFTPAQHLPQQTHHLSPTPKICT